MLRRCALLALVALPAVALPTVAHAQQIGIAVPPRFRAGERPYIAISSPVAARGVEAELTHDGKAVRVEGGAIRAGATSKLALPGPGHYEGSVVVIFSDGNRSTTQLPPFDAVVDAGSVSVGYAKERLDLDAHTLAFTMSRPAGRAELKVLGDDGAELATAAADYKGERPGTWLAIHWNPTRPGNVLTLDLTVTGSDGARGHVLLTPWQVAVPHDEVVFETGKWEVRPSEQAKLDAGYKKITEAVARVRKVRPDLPVKLFIAGHTDTVGSAADNRKLSLARAKAIGAWYRDRGLPLPIAFAGFGEDALKVKTPDESDNAANRRADYIVGVEEPTVARGVRATWMKLQ